MDEDRTQNQGEHESKLYFDKSGRIVDQDGNDIKDNPEALEKLQKLTLKINHSIMAAIERINGDTIKKAARKTENTVFDIVAASSTDEEIKEYYSLLKQLPPEDYTKMAADFSERLYQYQHLALVKIKATAAEEEQKLIEIGEKAGKLKARAESVKSYLKNELQKDIYNGETIETLIDDRPAEALADPDDDKTKLLLQAIAAAERAAHQPHEKIKAADKKRAAEAGAIYYLPKDILSITDKRYKGGTSFYNSGGATLALLKSDIDIQIAEQGRLSFPKLGELSEIEIENTMTHEQIESINLPLLRVFYTYIVEQANEAIKQGDKDAFNGKLIIDAGTLAAELGESRPTSTRARDKAIAAAKSFHNIAGKLVNDQHARPSYYQVLNFEKYDSKTNTITLRAPYLSYLFKAVYANNVRRDDKGKLQYKNNGDLLTKAYHGYGIQNELIKKYGRNKAVLENLFILDAVIEPAGKHPNITAREIINRNLYLSDLLKGKDTRSINRTLKRIFTQTWQALQETKLITMYETIKVPNPNDPQSIPTIDTLDFCYHFDNSGKKRND